LYVGDAKNIFLTPHYTSLGSEKRQMKEEDFPNMYTVIHSFCAQLRFVINTEFYFFIHCSSTMSHTHQDTPDFHAAARGISCSFFSALIFPTLILFQIAYLYSRTTTKQLLAVKWSMFALSLASDRKRHH
jgi:hypothetical protein